MFFKLIIELNYKIFKKISLMKRNYLLKIKDDKEKLKINISDYEELETAGLASFGRIRLCGNKNTTKIYALKILKKAEKD